MSTFKVKLHQGDQGKLDTHAAGNNNTSYQRTIYAPGPGGTNRKLADGEQFTDCNYWKRFAFPQVAKELAFIEVVTDDGTVYSDVPGENTFAKTYSLAVDAGDTYTDHAIDFVADEGGPAVFVQITSTGDEVNVRLNGSTDAVFSVASGATQIFNAGDLTITKLEFDNSESGAVNTVVSVIASIKSACSS